MKKSYCVYIITNKRNGTLYIGITGNLPQRMMQHKTRAMPGFASRYGSIGSSGSRSMAK